MPGQDWRAVRRTGEERGIETGPLGALPGDNLSPYRKIVYNMIN